MRCFSAVLLAIALAGCQNNRSDVAGDGVPSTNESDNGTAETGTADIVSQSQSVEEKLAAMDAMVVPNSNGGIKGVIFKGTEVSQQAIDLIVKIPELETLSFSGTSVGDRELELIGELTNLKVLLLGSTEVTDEGLAHINSLTNLQRLGLGDTQVTDAGLVHLHGLKNLKMLFLGQTLVTNQGVAAFGEAVPGCQIEQ